MKRVIGMGGLLTTRHTGQENPLNLLPFIGKLVWRGFGMQKDEYCLSRLMAFDAKITGAWGCLPKYYVKVLEFVLNKPPSRSSFSPNFDQ